MIGYRLLLAAVDQVKTSVGAHVKELVCFTMEVFSVAAANISDERAIWDRVHEFLNFRPCFISGVTEMRGDLFVNFIDMLLFHVCRKLWLIFIFLINWCLSSFSTEHILLNSDTLILRVAKLWPRTLARSISLNFSEG